MQGNYYQKALVATSCLFYGLTAFILGGIDSEQVSYGPFIEVKEEGDFIVYKKEELLSPESVIASKSGKRYYFPWCSGLKRIKKENRVFFKNVEIAKQNGLTLSNTCD